MHGLRRRTGCRASRRPGGHRAVRDDQAEHGETGHPGCKGGRKRQGRGGIRSDGSNGGIERARGPTATRFQGQTHARIAARTCGGEVRESSRDRRTTGAGSSNEVGGGRQGPGESVRRAKGGLDTDTQTSKLEGEVPSSTPKDMDGRQKPRTHGSGRSQRMDRAGTTGRQRGQHRNQPGGGIGVRNTPKREQPS